jgi:hypothetical protein
LIRRAEAVAEHVTPLVAEREALLAKLAKTEAAIVAQADRLKVQAAAKPRHAIPGNVRALIEDAGLADDVTLSRPH